LGPAPRRACASGDSGREGKRCNVAREGDAGSAPLVGVCPIESSACLDAVRCSRTGVLGAPAETAGTGVWMVPGDTLRLAGSCVLLGMKDGARGQTSNLVRGAANEHVGTESARSKVHQVPSSHSQFRGKRTVEK
jgi:hypothetical protein